MVYPVVLNKCPLSVYYIHVSRILMPKIETGKVNKDKSQVVKMVRSSTALDTDFVAQSHVRCMRVSLSCISLPHTKIVIREQSWLKRAKDMRSRCHQFYYILLQILKS